MMPPRYHARLLRYVAYVFLRVRRETCRALRAAMPPLFSSCYDTRLLPSAAAAVDAILRRIGFFRLSRRMPLVSRRHYVTLSRRLLMPYADAVSLR